VRISQMRIIVWVSMNGKQLGWRRRKSAGCAEALLISFPAILKALAFSTVPLTLVPAFALNRIIGHVDTSVASCRSR
jgi:hypothetical protein